MVHKLTYIMFINWNRNNLLVQSQNKAQTNSKLHKKNPKQNQFISQRKNTPKWFIDIPMTTKCATLI